MPTKVKEKLEVTEVVWAAHPHKTDETTEGDRKGRRDLYFHGNATINDIPMPFELHLMSDPSFSKKKGWYACVEFQKAKGRYGEDYDYCNKCSGSIDGYSGPSLLKDKLWKAIAPVAAERGWPLIESDGGSKFFVFQHAVPITKPMETGDSRRRFYIKMKTGLCCPIHGNFIQTVEEANV